MCTVTWIRDEDGFELYFNRDELVTRGPELEAGIVERGPLRALAPRDSDFGGTWVGVNEAGLAACLINDYPSAGAIDPVNATSRGRLVDALLGALSLEHALASVERTELARYRPFVLTLIAPGHPTHLLEWNGAHRRIDARGDAHMPLVSSSVELRVARERRRAHLTELVRDAGELSSEVLARFHASHDAGPSSISPCMHRSEAETRSLCHVSVTPSEVRLVHTPGPPCRTAPGPTLTLKRRAPA